MRSEKSRRESLFLITSFLVAVFSCKLLLYPLLKVCSKNAKRGTHLCPIICQPTPSSSTTRVARQTKKTLSTPPVYIVNHHPTTPIQHKKKTAIRTPSLAIKVTLRALQIFSSVVVLVLSTVLVKDYLIGEAPTSQSFGIFVGALTLVVAIAGLVCEVWIEKVSGKIVWFADAVAAVACFVGGTVSCFPLFFRYDLGMSLFFVFDSEFGDGKREKLECTMSVGVERIAYE